MGCMGIRWSPKNTHSLAPKHVLSTGHVIQGPRGDEAEPPAGAGSAGGDPEGGRSPGPDEGHLTLQLLGSFPALWWCDSAWSGVFVTSICMHLQNGYPVRRVDCGWSKNDDRPAQENLKPSASLSP